MGCSFKKKTKEVTITNAFQKIWNKSNCKPNKGLVNKGSKLYNKSMKSWFQDNDKEMCST